MRSNKQAVVIQLKQLMGISFARGSRLNVVTIHRGSRNTTFGQCFPQSMRIYQLRLRGID
ncbi:hypothetical protein AWN90_10845 [Nocardia terpenica]|uniref:Uncharacterized protein n=1 Tax=Nocardia terpenica TaxID=455432 RepID=A0A164HBY1_9NOCA|nr:hypothetical protein AWN90_10845 [Nocardia terpenica]